MGIASRLQNFHSGHATHEQIHKYDIVLPLLEQPKRLVPAGTAGNGITIASENSDTPVAKGIVALHDQKPKVGACAEGDGVRIDASLTIKNIRH